MAGILQSVGKRCKSFLRVRPTARRVGSMISTRKALDNEGIWRLHFYAWWWDDEYCIPLTDGETIVFTDDEARLVGKHGLTRNKSNGGA